MDHIICSYFVLMPFLANLCITYGRLFFSFCCAILSKHHHHHPGMGGEGDYGIGLGFGNNFGNGFGANGGPPQDQVALGQSMGNQKITGKKQKKDKVEKEKKGDDGHVAKKQRTSTSAKATAAAAAMGHNDMSGNLKVPSTFITQQPHQGGNIMGALSSAHMPPSPAHLQTPKSIFPLDPVSCALYNFSGENVNAHFKHIHEGMKITASRIREICMPILEQIFQVPHAFNIFGWPVDPVQLGIPDYNDVVKVPMDLGTVKRRLETGHYRDLHNFVQDVHLCFDNAMLYNPRNSDVHTLAKNLKREFDNHYKQAISLSEKAIELNRTNENACLVCGETCLKFEPPVYYCNGRCGGQRIRRNAFYYTNSNNTYHWCSSCFTDLRNDQPIKLPDSTLFKADLAKNKKKHSEDSEEPWVQCDGRYYIYIHI
jgi:hypothetical protein